MDIRIRLKGGSNMAKGYVNNCGGVKKGSIKKYEPKQKSGTKKKSSK